MWTTLAIIALCILVYWALCRGFAVWIRTITGEDCDEHERHAGREG